MSADRLREAARVLRERAEAATPGPWSAANEHGLLGPDAQPAWYVNWMKPGYESMLPEEGYLGDVAETFSNDRDSDPNATYIATMHPGVGLALADWLDKAAQEWDVWGEHDRNIDKPLVLADLILGAGS